MKTAYIVSTGTELMIGDTEDSNALFLSRRLAAIGVRVVGRSAVGDNEEMLRRAFLTGFETADIVISSGGLGPTMDDLTRQISCEVLGVPLEKREEEVVRLKDYFARRHRDMPAINEKQAYFPNEAIVLDNPRGSANGFIVNNENKTLILLPGPPRELEPMFTESAEPRIKEMVGQDGGVTLSYTIKAMGPGESKVETMIDDVIKNPEGCAMALLAKEGEVWVRVTRYDNDAANAQRVLESVIDRIKQGLGENVFGAETDTLPAVVVKALHDKKLTVAFAESCTGGLVSKLITDVPGSSDVLWGSVVSYSNEAKVKFLGVKPETLERYGAVSEQTAREMAEGIRKQAGSDFGIGITGIAGPGGGTEQKPVGLVYVVLADSSETLVKELHFLGGRDATRILTAKSALDWLRRKILRG
ncbi:MAG: competence/damage-inducible protein A [Candidatus Saccharibacteria bacterium]